MKRLSFLLLLLFCFSIAPVCPVHAARAGSAAEAVMKARFQKISKKFASKRKKMSRDDRRTAEDLLGMAAQLTGAGEYKDADYLLDRLEDLLAGRNPLGETNPIKVRQPQPDASLDNVTFTLADAFSDRSADGRKAPPKREENPKKAPKITPFDLDNFDKVDRQRFQILTEMLPDVEDVFRMHPNPETGEAVKNVRRFYYYLKKKGMGFPPEEEMELQLESFMQEKVIKVRE